MHSFIVLSSAFQVIEFCQLTFPFNLNIFLAFLKIQKQHEKFMRKARISHLYSYYITFQFRGKKLKTDTTLLLGILFFST